MATAISQKTMELEGNLRTFQLPDIMRFLSMGRMTGTLALVNGDRTVELTIKQGALVGAASDERFMRLGQLLVYSGVITRKDLDDVLESQHDQPGERMLGELLIEKQLVTSEQVEHALKLQIKEELWELFTWTDGMFKFEHGKPASLKRALLELPIEPIITEGLEHMQQWRGISQNLGNPDEVFTVRGDLTQPLDIKMTPNQWRVLSLLNGRNNVRMVIYLSALGRFETLCALDHLLSLQLIEPLDRRPRRNARAASEIQLIRTETLRNEADDTADSETDESQSGGIFALFGKKRKSGSGRDPHDTAIPGSRIGPYFTSVGLACALLNRLFDRLAQEAEFVEQSAGLLERLWAEEGCRYPRADLIELRDGRLDATQWERFVRAAGGIDRTLAGCHEEGMGALAAVARGLRHHARQALGERGKTLVDEVTRPYLDRVEVSHPADFMPRTWARTWMEDKKD